MLRRLTFSTTNVNFQDETQTIAGDCWKGSSRQKL